MKIGIIGTCAVAALAIAGCGKKDAAPAAAAEKPNATAPAATTADAGAMMVKVNGKMLTRGQIDADVAKFIEARKVPAEHIEEAKKMFGEQLAQAFVMKTLLLDEAQKKGIKIADADRAKAEAEFAKANKDRPGAPKTLKEAAKTHPLGEARGQQELEDSLVIQKLLEQEVTSKITVDAKKVAETLQNVTSNFTAQAKKAAEAGDKIKELKKQLTGLTGAALTNKFAELAKANSDCPSGKQAGGDLGEFTRGRMVKEFEEVAFKSEPFTVSDPVKTQFGWHLIMVTKKTPAVAAKGDKPAEQEKVQASHILLMARNQGKMPTKEDIEKGLKQQDERMALGKYFENLRKTAKIEAPGFPSLLPPPPAAAKPAAKPIESKPVQVKPAAKPAAAPAPAAKPAAPAAKPTAAPAPAVKPAAPAAKPAATPAPAAKK